MVANMQMNTVRGAAGYPSRKAMKRLPTIGRANSAAIQIQHIQNRTHAAAFRRTLKRRISLLLLNRRQARME